MKKIYIPILFMILIVSYSCDEFLDINNDPINPVEASIIQLLPSGQAAVAFGLANQLCRMGEDNVQHNAGRFDSWSITSDDVSNAWRFSLYAGGLFDFEKTIEKADESENYHFSAVAKLCKAYAYSMMVDMWDDIPYSEASDEEIPYPVFDDARSIYDNILLLIDEAMADFDKPLNATPADLSAVDLMLEGDVDAWKKMGSTLKLKMYNQMRLIEPALAKSQIESLVSSGNLIASNADDFVFEFGNTATPSNKHPGFQADYVTKGESHINTFFYNELGDNFDPRLPYFFYQQSDVFEGFFFSDPAPRGNDNDTRTLPGIYPVGGKYDDGSNATAGGNSAPGNGRFRMITNVMRLFIECEAALTLSANVSDSPRNLLQQALEANFAEINSLGAPTISNENRDTYINARLEAYDAAATDEERLAIVMREKWITSFGNGIEAWTDYRRTGYPVLNEPITPPNDVICNRLPYASDELTSNPNAPEQSLNNVKVFWDN